ncbi:MAG: segregation/condensation protein A [Fibrobacteria bacterium]|nr:segregation/condensation protein A [Fibrobacteria bacterium]
MATEELLRPTVRLDVFDGPLDLLLYLVHSHELDPRTIPVSEIADQYIAFLDSAHENDLSIAGEYLVMAAKLLALKARELLPREQQGELEPEEFDGFDRGELVKQLLEYRRFKQAAENLRTLEARVWGAYPRGMSDSQGEKPRSEDDDTLEAGLMGLFDLLKAFRSVLSVRPRHVVHEIEIDDIPLEERMNRIRAHLVREGKALFDELYPHDGRKLLPVVTFMAIMELTKNEELAFRQAGTFLPMTVYRKADERYADELADMDQVYSPDPVLNPDVLGLLAEKERLRQEAMAREEATWGGNGLDPETGEPLEGLSPDLIADSVEGGGGEDSGVASPSAGDAVVEGPAEPAAEQGGSEPSPTAGEEIPPDAPSLPEEIVPEVPERGLEDGAEAETPPRDLASVAESPVPERSLGEDADPRPEVSAAVGGRESDAPPEGTADDPAPDVGDEAIEESETPAEQSFEEVETESPGLREEATGTDSEEWEDSPLADSDVAPSQEIGHFQNEPAFDREEVVATSPDEEAPEIVEDAPMEVSKAAAPTPSPQPSLPSPPPAEGTGSSGNAAQTGGSWLAAALAAARAQLGQSGGNSP